MDENETSVSIKIKKYEQFLNENLREDLKILEKRLQELNNKISTWYRLKKSLEDTFENHPRGFKTKTDIGCGFLMQATVTEPSVIKMHIGLDIYLEMTLDDGIKYCDSRINMFDKELRHIQKQANNVKVHIKLVLLGLKELQQL